MIFFYKTITTILYPLLVLLIYLRKTFKKEDPVRYKEKIFSSYFRVKRKNDYSLYWFHAASIGEFKSILPLIREIGKRDKKIQFLITTITLSSSLLAKKELAKIKNSHHRFLPIDTNFIIKKFIELWKPNRIFLVDSEIWPNLILNSKKLKIPLALINARITSKSSKRWLIFTQVAKKIFQNFNLCICSNEETKKFLEKLSVKNVYFKGNIKLINEVDSRSNNINKEYLSNKRFWLAASTHREEDQFCLNTHLKLKDKYSDIITIIAPRHTDRSQKIKLLCESRKLKAQILNKNEHILENKEIIIINFFGEMQNYFKYAKSVFIGKSMIKKLKDNGGQNPLEAAKFRCKVYHGPYVYNFKDIYKILKSFHYSKQIENYIELSDNLKIDLEKPFKENNQISVNLQNLGQKTLKDTMRLLNKFLDNEIN